MKLLSIFVTFLSILPAISHQLSGKTVISWKNGKDTYAENQKTRKFYFLWNSSILMQTISVKSRLLG